MATKAQSDKLVAQALKEDNKSEGMRSLLRSGMTVAQVREAFDAPYGYVYGVAVRLANAGEIDLADVTTPRGEAAPAAAKAPAKAKATKAAPAKAAATKAAPRTARTAGKAATAGKAKARA